MIGLDTMRINALRKKWQKETKDLDHPELLERSASIARSSQARPDDSITNLSSIVFVTRYADGLERAGFPATAPRSLTS